MSKDIVIVESPAKARTISRILGGELTVLSSMGHVRDLPEKSLGIDVENGFKPKYKTSTGRKKTIDALIAAVKGADRVFLATDPDREGEAIAWHLFELLKKHLGNDDEFHRVTFHEITKKAVSLAFENPEKINMNLVNAQQARRILDRLVGYQVSPLLWSRIDNTASAGRVQSIALRLICEREVKVLAFKPEEYWNFLAQFKKADADATSAFEAKLVRIDDEKCNVGNTETAMALAEDAKKGTYRVAKVKKEPRTRRPTPPFITSTLQQAASSHLRFGPEQTMRVAQQLYEGVDINGVPTGLITYMRTDSVTVATQAQDESLAFIRDRFGPDYAPAKPNRYRSKQTAQEAHEAIRPTDPAATPDTVASHLDRNQLRLYELIWKRFMASQMSPAAMERHTVELANDPDTCEHRFLFRAGVTSIRFDGFLKVYNLKPHPDDPGHASTSPDSSEASEEDDGAVAENLPELNEQDQCDLLDLKTEQKFTEPPPRYSEASLIRELEENGVGRPSTYAGIVKTIQTRNYADKEKGKLIPSDRGTNVNHYLTTTMPELFQVPFTALMENDLDTIEQGNLEWEDMLSQFYEKFSRWLEVAKETTDVPADTVVKSFMDAFPDSLKWNPPETRGKRTYDDSKFFESLATQMDGGKKLSDKQWIALLKLALRYQAQIPDLHKTAATLGIDETINQLAADQKAREEKQKEDRAEDGETREIIKHLGAIHTWEEPVKRGKRVYDDSEFRNSVVGQFESGRSLSIAQVKALKRLLEKYHEQIPQFDAIKDELGLTPAPSAADMKVELDTLFALADDVKDWKKSESKGRRRYGDESFVTSLRKQFGDRGRLSEKQINAFRKIIMGYKEQIPDFDTRTADITFPDPTKDASSETDVDCPKCGEAKLLRRRGRGRNVFFGCGRYPKCDFTTSDLEKLDVD